MAYSLNTIHEPSLDLSSDERNTIVDIVAIHDLNHSVQHGWTEPQSGILWLRDLLPRSLGNVRILSFEYESAASSFFSTGCERAIRTTADNLLTSLQSDRQLECCPSRPIIFLCHGIGGLVVKQALIHASTQTSPKVEIYYGVFVSTYAILFFGTPHNSCDGTKWVAMDERQRRAHRLPLHKSNSSKSSSLDFEMIRAVNARFVPFLKHFHVYYFWAEMMTDFGDHLDHLVEDVSAAPVIDDTERAAIYADHYAMVQHRKTNSSSYKAVLAALLRYSRAAPSLVARRWEKANSYLAGLRSERAFELTGFDFDIHAEDTMRKSSEASENLRNQYFMLPREASTEFIGRVDIVKEIETSLFFASVHGTRQKIVVVHGIGGCGKTRICCRYAWEMRSRYWGIFTIDATSLETAKASFSDLGRLGGLGATETAGRHWLSIQNRPWLLIVDNADDPTLDVAALIPGGIEGHILITTRNNDLRRLATPSSIELKGMRRSEALELLLKRAEIAMPWGKATEELGYSIAEALGYLALALTQAGNCISRKLCDLDTYLSVHDLYRGRHKAQGSRRKIIHDDEFNVYATFDFSLSSLHDRPTTAAQDAQEILSIVSFYHFDNIRVDIFSRALEYRKKAMQQPEHMSRKAWSLALVEQVLQPPPVLPKFLKDDASFLDQYRIRRALYELYKLSFITYSTNGKSFSLHPLVHSWARDRLTGGERKLWSHVALNTLLTSIDLPPSDVDDAEGSFKHDMLPHLDASLKHCPPRIGFGEQPMTASYLTFCKFFGWSLFFIMRHQILATAKCGYVYASRGQFLNAAKYLIMAKDALAQILGDKDEKTMMAMLGLANVFWGLGRLEEAITLQRRVIDARNEVYGLHHANTLRAMDMLGKSYWLHGQYHEALSVQEVTTKHMPKVLGAEHPDTLATMDNYGVTLGSWHRYVESRDVHAQVLAIRKKASAPNHLDTLTTMNNLGMALLDLGDLQEAKELMSKVYSERYKQLGKEHPWTLWALCNLAKVKIELGGTDLYDAEELLIEGIAAGKRSLSEDHLGVLMGCGALALAFARQGRLHESEKLVLETLNKMEASRGPFHPDSVTAQWKLSLLYEKQGRVDEAKAGCHATLERIRMRLTTEHPLYAIVQDKLEALERGKPQERPKARPANEIAQNAGLIEDTAVRHGNANGHYFDYE